MGKKTMKRSIIVIFALQFIFTTFLPFVNASEGKPDLVIDDIFLWPSNFPNEYQFEYSLKNIGDSPLYDFELETYVKIQWMLFGKIPIFSIASNLHSGYLGRLLPGETVNITFASCGRLPKFGTYRFSLTVNPSLNIEESNYDNNKYSENWKVFFGKWKHI
jgi:subtilase family serine protease